MKEPQKELVMSRHTVHYEVLNNWGDKDFPDRDWEIDVHASPEELQNFEKSGYLVREALFTGDGLERLREALDQLEKREYTVPPEPSSSKKSWGRVPRYLMDKDQAFLDLLKFPPTLSIARAMMGPLVRLRGLSARISYPNNEVQETPWHIHLRVISNPLPPWFSRPHCIDALIYLDDLNDETGPVALVPGSHEWLDKEPPAQSYEPAEGEMALCVKAGDVVMIHGNLWHRAMPTRSKKRRMLILSYTPSWLRKSPHGGPQPEDGLTKQFLGNATPEERMLLGLGGYS
ncbi:MAG: phytanoyl-CoA dioxygenase family protein [Planctomycetota bacterium]|nr:phytanoyl-CoA dioxygenase family protein [Planctomycetota bacterium]